MALLIRFCLALLLMASPAHAEELHLAEQHIKAGLIYNFLKYTDWPDEAGTMEVCVLEENGFSALLKRMEERSVNRRAIHVRMLKTTEDAASCSLIFVNASRQADWRFLKEILASRPVLTVGDFEGFAAAGGIIEFRRQDNRVTAILNRSALGAAHLTVQQRLVQLVTVLAAGGAVTMRKGPLSLRATLLLTVGMLTVLIVLLSAREVIVQWQRIDRIHDLNTAGALSDDMFDAMEKISGERDLAFALIYAPESASEGALRERLKENGQKADALLDAVLLALKDYDLPAFAGLRQETEAKIAAFRALRRELDAQAALPPAERDPGFSDRWFTAATGLIVQVQRLWMGFIREFTDIDPVVTLHMRLKHSLGLIMDYSGRERATIGRLIAANTDPKPEEQADLLRWQGSVEIVWERIGSLGEQSMLADSIAPYVKDARSHYATLNEMVGDLFYIPGAKHEGQYPLSVELWLEVANQATDSLYALKKAAQDETRGYRKELERRARQEVHLHLLVLAAGVALCLYSFRTITRRVMAPIDQMVTALVDTMQGKPEVALSPEAADRADEIGKLARVLHAFQRNVGEIRRYTRDLERSNKELDDFAYIASHDLKEPLRGIHNHARFLLEDNAAKLDEESTGRLHRLVYLSQRMERLVNDLLYFSRLGRQDLAIQPADLNAVVQDIAATLEHFLEERHGKILVPQQLPTLTCDKLRVTELLRNLITNALKYNDAAERTVEVGFLPGPQAIYVKDNGRGIAPEFHEEIFRIFKRLQASKDPLEEGTGAGLTFVRKIVERHGGKIWLESEVGKGTTFFFTLNGGDHATTTHA